MTAPHYTSEVGGRFTEDVILRGFSLLIAVQASHARSTLTFLFSDQFKSRNDISVSSRESPCLFVLQDPVRIHVSERPQEFLIFIKRHVRDRSVRRTHQFLRFLEQVSPHGCLQPHIMVLGHYRSQGHWCDPLHTLAQLLTTLCFIIEQIDLFEMLAYRRARLDVVNGETTTCENEDKDPRCPYRLQCTYCSGMKEKESTSITFNSESKPGKDTCYYRFSYSPDGVV